MDRRIIGKFGELGDGECEGSRAVCNPDTERKLPRQRGSGCSFLPKRKPGMGHIHGWNGIGGTRT